MARVYIRAGCGRLSIPAEFLLLGGIERDDEKVLFYEARLDGWAYLLAVYQRKVDGSANEYLLISDGLRPIHVLTAPDFRVTRPKRLPKSELLKWAIELIRKRPSDWELEQEIRKLSGSIIRRDPVFLDGEPLGVVRWIVLTYEGGGYKLAKVFGSREEAVAFALKEVRDGKHAVVLKTSEAYCVEEALEK